MAERPLPSERDIRARLDQVKDPCSVACGRAMGLAEMGIVDRIAIGDDGKVDIYLKLTSPACYMLPFMERESIRALMELPGITGVAVHPDEGLDWSPALMAPHLRAPAMPPAPRRRASAEIDG